MSQTDGETVVKAKDLNIIWGNDATYWKQPQREDDPAELIRVSWLEVTGQTSSPMPKGKYEISFDVEMKNEAFGWDDCPLFIMAKVGKRGRYAWKKIKLVKQNGSQIREKIQIDVSERQSDKIYFGLYDVWSGKWKGGLLIHKAIIKKMPDSS